MDITVDYYVAPQALTAAEVSAANAAASAEAAASSAAAAAISNDTCSTNATNAANSAAAAAESTAIAVAAAGFQFVFDNQTTMADPGAGVVRFNNATIASVTAIAIDNLSADTGNPDVSPWVLTFDDSTNTATAKGLLRFRKVGDAAVYVDFSVTGLTDNDVWMQLSVSHVGSSGSIVDGDVLVTNFSRSGNDGQNGAGVPVGGADGDMLIKLSSGDYHTAWTAPAPTLSSLAPVKTKIMAGAADVTALFIGDSTSLATTHWVYRLAQWLATEYPTHSVVYRLWDDGAGNYGAPSTIATGTGARTINVYNASVGGFHIGRWMTTRYANAIGALTPDLIVTNDGGNLTTGAVQDIRRRYLAAFQRLLLDKPGTPIAVTLQHAFRDDNTMDNAIAALRQAASHFPGLTLIDAHARFVEAGKPAGWYENNTHPNTTGHGVMLAEAQRHWRAARDRHPVTSFDSWWADRAQFNLLPNGSLAAFTAALPDYWGTTAAAGTITKDTTTVYPGKPHSLRVEGMNKTVLNRIEGRALEALRGRRLTLAVRVYAATGGHSSTGKFWITIDGVATAGYSTDIGSTEGNGWQWQVIDDIRVPVTATSVEVALASTSTGSASGVAYFDEVLLYQGEAAPEHAGEVLTDLDNQAPAANLFQDGGRFGGTPEPQTTGITAFTAPNYVFATNGATIVAGPKYIFNNNDYGGTAGALDPDVLALVVKTKDPHINLAYGRYGVEYYLLDITAGSGTATSRTIGGVAHYLPFSVRTAPIPLKLSFNCHCLVKSGSVGVTVGTNYDCRLHIDGRRQHTDLALLPADGWRQITRLFDTNPRRSIGYNNILTDIYATPGTRFYLAAPALVAGHIPIAPDYFYGTIPSLEAWR